MALMTVSRPFVRFGQGLETTPSPRERGFLLLGFLYDVTKFDEFCNNEKINVFFFLKYSSRPDGAVLVVETRPSTSTCSRRTLRFAQETIYVRIHHSKEENKEEEEEDVKASNVLNRGPCARKGFDLLLSSVFGADTRDDDALTGLVYCNIPGEE